MYNVHMNCILFISCTVFIVLIAEHVFNVLHCILFISYEAVFIVLIAEHVFNVLHYSLYLM